MEITVGVYVTLGVFICVQIGQLIYQISSIKHAVAFMRECIGKLEERIKEVDDKVNTMGVYSKKEIEENYVTKELYTQGMVDILRRLSAWDSGKIHERLSSLETEVKNLAIALRNNGSIK
jgi:hypothetical protein